MTRRVLLVEIGTPAELPVVTPPAPRPPSAWVPDPRPSPGLPPPTGLAAVSIADAAVLSWTPSTAGGQTIVEAAPDVAGVPGIWREIARVGGDTYTISLPGGPRWVRVRAELNGRTSVATNAVLAEPVPVGDISEFEQELRDLQDLVDAVAAQAAADAAALNVRADDLRADIDATIAEVSTLADLTDDLGTEITRVETESVTRDTATVETISLLGAKNGAGTAFILDGNTLRVSPTETLAQWRNSIQGEFASQSSRIDNEVQARQDGDQALATTLSAVQATANNAATKAELTAAETALAAADVAEANARNALAVQLRGGYTGTNPASLTQGLIYNERQARITAEGAIASTVAAMQLDLDGKAAASDLAATQLTVSQQGDTLTAHGTQLSGLSASVGGVEASVNELREVSISGSNVVTILDHGFEGRSGWTENLDGSGDIYPTNPSATEHVQYSGVSPRSGSTCLRFVNTPRALRVRNKAYSSCAPGQVLRIGWWIRMTGSLDPSVNAQVTILWFDSNRNNVGWTRIRNSAVESTGWRYESNTVQVPLDGGSGTPSFFTIELRVSGPSPGNVYFDDVTGNVLGEDLQSVLASYVLAMNAGNKVSGLKFLNDGSVSNATFLFDNFDFETADGSFRISDGRTITRSNGYMRVEGKPFGQNNEMVVWYGPEQPNLANCRRNNAISFETNNGLHYSIGAMFSGTISAGGYTTAIAATSYSTGAFGTNGGPIVVNASFTHSRQQLGGKQQSPNWQKNTISAGSGTTSATIELWRRIGTGSWQLVASATREGVLSIQSFPGEPDVDDVAQWNNTVSLTYTDNAGGTQNRDFEVRVIQNVYQGIVISGSAPVPPPTDSRSLGVRTSE